MKPLSNKQRNQLLRDDDELNQLARDIDRIEVTGYDADALREAHSVASKLVASLLTEVEQEGEADHVTV